MTLVQGEFEVTMDAKGRFLLPAKLLSQLPQGAATHFVINRGLDDCLYLHPMENWMEESQRNQRFTRPRRRQPQIKEVF